MTTTEEIKALRDETGLSVMECQKALEDAAGDKEKAIQILKERSITVAAKRSQRTLGAGVIVSYIHASGTIGAMLELLCETDFVARNSEFKAVAYEIAMHIAAMDPQDVQELLDQPFIKDSDQKIRDLINGAGQKFGERTEMGKFVRFSI